MSSLVHICIIKSSILFVHICSFFFHFLSLHYCFTVLAFMISFMDFQIKTLYLVSCIVHLHVLFD